MSRDAYTDLGPNIRAGVPAITEGVPAITSGVPTIIAGVLWRNRLTKYTFRLSRTKTKEQKSMWEYECLIPICSHLLIEELEARPDT